MNSLESNALDRHLVMLADLYAARMEMSLWRVGHLAASRGSFFIDLKNENRHCQTNTYMRVLHWFRDRWPEDMVWPETALHPGQAEK